MTGAAASVLSYTRIHRAEVGSTNAEAAALARAGGADGTVLTADCQVEGRGRHGRSWASPVGNLHMSLLLRPGCRLAAASQLGFVAALSVAEALKPMLPVEAPPECKWPNDVLAGGGKIAGILLESAGPDSEARVAWVVVGIGINAAHAPAAQSEGGAGLPAVSLEGLAGGCPGAAALADAVLGRFARHYAAWQAEGFAPIRRRWLGHSRPRGTAIEVRLPRERLNGRFEEIDATGALVLSTGNGARHTVAAGDVFFPDEAA